MSARLMDSDVRAALLLCAELPVAADPQALRRMTLRAVSGLVRCEAACWYDWSPREWRLTVTTEPAELGTPEFAAAVAGALHTHPIAQYQSLLGGGPVVSMSDFLDDRALRRTAVYTEVYRRLGVTRELGMALPTADGLACLAVYRRGRDFTRRERERLDLVRAPLATALRLLSERTPVTGGLTARESEVLAALVAGATPSQIALQLEVSRRTVHKHLEHVYRKLGVTHGGAAVARALGTG